MRPRSLRQKRKLLGGWLTAVGIIGAVGAGEAGGAMIAICGNSRLRNMLWCRRTRREERRWHRGVQRN